MNQFTRRGVWPAVAVASLLATFGPGLAQDRWQTSYAPVDIKETIGSIITRMKQAKPEIEKRQVDLLNERYDLGNRPASGVTMAHPPT
jgi:hypothetical protein